MFGCFKTVDYQSLEILNRPKLNLIVVSVDFVETTDDVSEQDGAIVVVIEIQGVRTRPVTVR